jgi:hypothetical protein
MTRSNVVSFGQYMKEPVTFAIPQSFSSQRTKGPNKLGSIGLGVKLSEPLE